MSRQDKATSDRHTKILRELVKNPENKVCADCKRNDPRWASWNIGVFVCIRCSGIHRGMGTHISKVKSVDLDVWTPEQMQSIQNWGNHRANLYWEAHLKPGHVPPDHKMESFIRSKYEGRRWALEGPPPSDPSVLDNAGSAAEVPELPAATAVPPPPAQSTLPAASAVRPVQKPSAHTLLSSALTASPRHSAPMATQPVVPQPASANLAASPLPATTQNELFTLDFHSPPPLAPVGVKRDVKSDILSLFGSSAVGVGPSVSTTSPTVTSLAGQGGGAAMWGAQSGFGGLSSGMPGAMQTDVWSQPQPSAGTSNSVSSDPFGADIWSDQSQSQPTDDMLASFPSTHSGGGQKKSDAFLDLWGDFK